MPNRPANPHPCPCGCGEQIPQSRLSCRASWFSLPKPLRDRINRNWRRDRTEHRAAIREAIQLLTPTPNGGTQ